VEKGRREFLKKMRNPGADALQKSAIMKKVRDKCKLSRCSRCDYRNGNLLCIVLITFSFHTGAW
jgi:DNA-directed RNA polymerase III subunit RPC1